MVLLLLLLHSQWGSGCELTPLFPTGEGPSTLEHAKLYINRFTKNIKYYDGLVCLGSSKQIIKIIVYKKILPEFYKFGKVLSTT